MRIRLNGEEYEIDHGASVVQLLERLALRPERVAVERNRTVAKRADWASTVLEADDEIEILTFVGGG
jgi:thiamine biosynthesis protein ThiS